jgi:Zn-dependent M16 (insulinase) family peptidase
MIKSTIIRVTLTGVIALAASAGQADQAFEALEADQAIADFRVENVYENAAGTAMGGRFRHAPSGFVLDMLRIQSVPQAFIWVNSPPPSDQGEPHTCEHLLLGKGTKGRYVASLEGMSLGKSSAFTMQLQTCYHFHTPAGTDVFLDLLEAKLDAMLHPTFSDEEIRREVCNIGYTIDPVDSTLRLEEKGTVYNEMVSSYERPWSNLGLELGRMMYGENHPLSNESGGLPAAIRTMTPDDLRRFHGATHHLSNMGMIVSIPNDITLTDCLGEISAILARVEPDAQPDEDPATLEERLPPARPETPGTTRQVSFPHQNEEEPGLLVFGWGPVLEMDNNEEYILDLFIENLAGGSTSNLYRKFIDSQTRDINVGANSVFGWSSSDPGHPIYIGLNNVRRDATEAGMIDSIRALILAEIKRIAAFADGSDALSRFNERARGLIIERRRDLQEFLNSPPGFGFRGSGAQWFFHLKHLQKTTGFRKRLTLDSELAFAENLLESGHNFWSDYISAWGLLERTPYAVASRPDPERIERTEAARKERIDAFLAHLQREYGVATKDEAKQRYREEYDAKTAVIDTEAASIPMPQFVEGTPQTLDDQLQFTEEKLPGGGPIVTSTFENMTSATAGLAFGMDVVPPDLLLYISALPTLMTEVGVIRDGQAIPYDEMKDAVRREILELRTYYSTNYRTERIELTVRAAGSDEAEIVAAADWMEAVLYHPDWRPENLPRIRDAVDLQLKSLRNTMRGSEESWVDDPANAYWRQTNPLLLAGDCFLTRTHALHRLRWRLKQTPSAEDEREFAAYLEQLAGVANGSDRDALGDLISGLLNGDAMDVPIRTPNDLPAGARALAKDALADLKQSLADIPDATLTSDWRYLCQQMVADLRFAPETALNDLQQLMSLIRRADNVRSFTIANSANEAVLRPRIKALVGRLGQEPSIAQAYSRRPRIVARLQERTPDLDRPVFVGLINENTRSGVHINSATSASYVDTDREKLLDFLSARLYGGWGAHSMYMKTWAAGLAYSNGLRHNESTGRMIYYAERCPDLAQTMQFVVNELKNAPYDTSLAQYAIAQAYVGYRGGEGYEQRGEAMAADLVDGVTPEKVTRFFDGVLSLRDSRDLYGEIHGRMPYTYGKILPGYGQSGAEVSDAIYFVIGPESQFQSYEQYLRSVEGDVTLHRLYPRDFWLVDENLD